MDAVPASVITGALVIGGKTAQGKSPTVQNIVGIGGIAIGLALLEQVNARMASAFAWLIIFGVAAVYFIPLVNSVYGKK